MRLARKTIAALLLATSCCFAAPPTTAPAKESADAPAEIVYRTYDLADLLRPAKDYPLAKQDSGGQPIVEDSKSPTAGGGTLDGIVTLLESFVDAQSWRDNGGLDGAIQPAPSRTAIVVAQTLENQNKIDALLKTLRNQSGLRTMVSIRVSWVLMEPKDIDQLFAKSTVASVDHSSPMPTVDDDLLAKSKPYCQAQNTCFNGQTVSIQSGRDWGYVSDVTPVVGTNAVGYDPQISSARTGVTLQVTPQLTPDDDGRVVLDLHSTVGETTFSNNLGIPQPTTRPAEGVAGGEAPFALLQRPNMVSQSFATTVRIPLGKRVIIGGMTLPPEANSAESRNLYLLVQADAVR